MNEISIKDAVRLVKNSDDPAVSIFINTECAGDEGQLKLRYKLYALVQRVESMVAATYDRVTKDRFIKSLRNALAAINFRKNRGGLAIFHSAEFSGVVRLPSVQSDMAIAAESYHIKPVLKCLQLRRNFIAVLAHERFTEVLWVAPEGFKRIGLLDAGLSVDHVARMVSRELNGQNLQVILVSHSKRILAVSRALQRRRVPTIELAAETEKLDRRALLAIAQKAMDQHWQEFNSSSVRAFHEADVRGEAADDIYEVARQAVIGNVRQLFIAEDVHLWGLLDRTSGRVTLIDEKREAISDDVLDDLAELVIAKGGSVIVLPQAQMPTERAVAAILVKTPWVPYVPPAYQVARLYKSTESRRA